jgi:hypothetical protein
MKQAKITKEYGPCNGAHQLPCAGGKTGKVRMVKK